MSFELPLSDPWFYVAVLAAVIVIGLAKGGFAGLGVLAVPILSLVMPPTQAAAITLPVLISQDAVSVWVFRGLWDLRLVGVLLSGAIVGVWLGYALAASVSQAGVELAVGAVSAVFGAQRLWLERSGKAQPMPKSPTWLGVGFGLFAGFTSQIAHAGGPPVQMFLMPRQTRDAFLGTSTLFFAAINLIKVPAYIALGQFTRENLLVAGAMLPITVGFTLLGAKLARGLAGPAFYRIVYVLMVLLGLKLVWDGASG